MDGRLLHATVEHFKSSAVADCKQAYVQVDVLSEHRDAQDFFIQFKAR